MLRFRFMTVLLLAAILAVVSPAPADLLELEVVARGLQEPVGIAFEPGDASRLYAVGKRGLVQVVERGSVRKGAFLDLRDRVSRGMEQGLLGMAFHPRFKTTGKFYVNYTDRRGDTHVTEFRASGGKAVSGSERDILYVGQPYSNHNGGHLIFGRDGLLYIGLGDGGSGYDPQGKAQNRNTFLGKMIRINVDSGEKPTIIGVGLRNPWRYSFDRLTGDLYIGDVGQNTWEEVDVVPAARLAWQNFGWPMVEGKGHCVGEKGCDQSGLLQPAIEYPTNTDGCSVVGGYVYRGKALPELSGTYFYADYCNAWIRSFKWAGGRVLQAYDWSASLPRLSRLASFGEDADGELYLASLAGTLYKFVRGSAGAR